MKKILMIVALCVFMAIPAFADEPLNGTIIVDSITVYAGNPAPPCDLVVSYTTCNAQGPYVLPTTADGDLINDVLQEAQVGAIPVDVGLILRLDAGPPPSFSIEVVAAEFGSGTLCP